MNILFYTPFNLRSRDTESVMEAFVKQGHQVFLLTQVEEGLYHEACKKIGVRTFSHCIKKGNSILYYLKHTRYLIKFCKLHNIEIVYAHLETAALPAVYAQGFIKAKVYACRHIIDEAYLFNNKNFIRLNKIVYKKAKNIIVVSEHCKKFMVEKENINPNKIKVIRLAYNFNLYNKPDPSSVDQIKKKYPADLLLITACRLVTPKRADYSIEVVEQLIKKGLNIKLLVLGSGPELENLKTTVQSKKLENSIFVLGYQSNIVDYLAAMDLLVHPSILDSSSVIIKESGLLSKPVIACKTIGDVDEYLIHRENSLLVSKENTVAEMLNEIEWAFANKNTLSEMGKKLQERVIQRFSIDELVSEYIKIHESIRQ